MVSFYFDEMMPRVAAEQLTEKEYIVVMANDVSMTAKTDEEHLAYAVEHGLVLVTYDRAFAGRTSKSFEHNGLICLSGQQDEYGKIVRTLAEFADNHAPNDTKGRIFWL